MSFTVTVKEQLVKRDEPSVALNVTVVVPTGNISPLPNALRVDMVTPGQLSEAVPVNVCNEPHALLELFTLILAGQEMVGFWLSLTVTVNEQSSVFPAPSVALQVTVVVPVEKKPP